VEPAYRVSDDIYALRTYFPVPTLGLVPVNAFVLQAREPVLIDTGLIAEHDQFMATLESIMDPRDLRWLWLTHPDPDHVGSLQQLVTDNPHLRVITTFLGFGMLSLFCQLPGSHVPAQNGARRWTWAIAPCWRSSGQPSITRRRPP
jgi:flavorubredoxin